MGRLSIPIIVAALAAYVAVAPAGAERMPSADDTRAVFQALSMAPDDERPAWRWRLARDYAARGLHAEADGVLRVLAADTPPRAQARDFRLLHAKVLTALGEADTALQALDTPIVEGSAETCLLRLAAYAKLHRHSDVRASFACAEAALTRRAGAARTPYLMAVARSEMALGDERMAEALLSRMESTTPAEAGEADFWRGVIAARRGQNGLAVEHFQKAVAGPHPVAALRAEVAMTELRVSAGALSVENARRRLRKLEHVWRGGAAERDLLLAAGRLADRAGDLRGAFASYGAAALYLDGDPAGTPLADWLSQRFETIFADGGESLKPVDAFALFWDYRNFAPQGPRADAMVRRLADRLAGLGLSAQAASLLEHQVYNRLEGTARAVVAVRLASLLNDSGHYARALSVLAATRAGGVPDDVRLEHNFAEAAALIGSGRPAEAKALIGEARGARARGLRAEAAWAARDWAAVIDLMQANLPPAESATAPAALSTLLRVTVAAAMDGDDALLRRLHERYSTRLAKTEIAPAFEALTGDPAKLSPGELRAALADAAARASVHAPIGGKTA